MHSVHTQQISPISLLISLPPGLTLRIHLVTSGDSYACPRERGEVTLGCWNLCLSEGRAVQSSKLSLRGWAQDGHQPQEGPHVWCCQRLHWPSLTVWERLSCPYLSLNPWNNSSKCSAYAHDLKDCVQLMSFPVNKKEIASLIYFVLQLLAMEILSLHCLRWLLLVL